MKKNTMARLGISIVFSLVALVPLASASATALSSTQINAIMSLLRAFGADASVVANVEASLSGSAAPQLTGVYCVDLSHSLSVGQTDASTNGDVSKLQRFLGVSPSGYFGPQTQYEVQKWQRAHGIASSGTPGTTGYGVVGPQTNTAMACPVAGRTAQPTPAVPASQLPGVSQPPALKEGTTAPSSNPAQPVASTACPVPVRVYTDVHAADYPRMIQLSDGRLFLGFSGTNNGRANILAYTSSDDGMSWQSHSIVAQDAVKSFFAPSFFEVSPGNILAAYYQRCDNAACHIAITDALYANGSWKPLGTVQTGGVDWGNGVYEPFWFKKDASTLQLYYADEASTVISGYAMGQSVVKEERPITALSGDWTGTVITVAKGNIYPGVKYGERYGVPAVARMSNGDLIAVFESTLGISGGDYGLGYATSNDNGTTWSNPAPLLNPPAGKANAGATSIATLSDGTLIVTFSDSESRNASLTNARMHYIFSTDNGATWHTNNGNGYALFNDYALFGSMVQLPDGKIVVAKGGPGDWLPGEDTSIYTKTYANEQQFFSCTGASRSSAFTAPPTPPHVQTPVPPVVTSTPAVAVAPATAPASISHACSASGTSVTFSWPSVSGATAYWPFIKTVSACPSGWGSDPNVLGTCYQPSITTTSVTYDGITPGKSYTGWVHSQNVAGTNWDSMVSTGSFSCPPPTPVTPPPAPASISHACSASGTSVTFSWPSVSGATAYWPFVKTVAACPAGWSSNPNAPGTCYESGTTATSATFDGITPGTSYIGWVHSQNSAGANWNAMASTNWFSCSSPSGVGGVGQN